MIQSKLLESWSSLQANEKRVIQIILLAVPLIIISIYFVNITNKISAKKLNLTVAKNNFDYVYNKALDFQKLSLAQKALSEY